MHFGSSRFSLDPLGTHMVYLDAGTKSWRVLFSQIQIIIIAEMCGKKCRQDQTTVHHDFVG